MQSDSKTLDAVWKRIKQQKVDLSNTAVVKRKWGEKGNYPHPKFDPVRKMSFCQIIFFQKQNI